MIRFKRCLCTVGILSILIPAPALGIKTVALGEILDDGINLHGIKSENAKINSVVDGTAKKISNDKQKIKQKAAEISKNNKVQINTEAKKAENIINSSVKNNISEIKTVVKQTGANQRETTVNTDVTKPVNVTANISPTVTVKQNVKVNVVNKPFDKNISNSISLIKVISLKINKPKTILIINNLISVIPLPIIVFKPVSISLPNFLGGNTSTLPDTAFAPPEKAEIINKAVFAGLPQTGSLIDFTVLIVNGGLCIIIGIIVLLINKKFLEKHY